jgi:hypothetical protein
LAHRKWRAVLVQSGWEARNGGDALHCTFSVAHLHCVVADPVTPGMDGREFGISRSTAQQAVKVTEVDDGPLDETTITIR